MSRILVVAAHSDDEALGCGGTIARHVAHGDTVEAVFLADGVTSRAESGAEDLAHRLSAAESARKILGMTTSHYLGLPDNRLDSLSLIEVIQPLEKIIADIKPDIVYTHHCGDLNVDHQIACRAILTACRPLPGQSVRAIYSYEVVSSTGWGVGCDSWFIPNVYVDISEYLHTKQDALRAYAAEMREAPHARSYEHVEALARHRGNSVGVDAAEAFMLIREIKQ